MSLGLGFHLKALEKNALSRASYWQYSEYGTEITVSLLVVSCGQLSVYRNFLYFSLLDSLHLQTSNGALNLSCAFNLTSSCDANLRRYSFN